MRALRWSALVALLTLLLALPGAHAGYADGGELEADAPVALEGRVDVLLPHGVASLMGAQGATPVVTLVADEIHFTHRTVGAGCDPAPAGLPTGCAGAEAGVEDEAFTLTDARVSVTRTLSGYKVVVTTDRAYADSPSFGPAGKLVVTPGLNALLGANPKPLSASAFDSAWTGEPRALAEPVYQAEGLSAQIGATGGLLRASGGFEAFLQGVQVRVTGTDAEGAPFERTLDAPMPQREGDPTTYFVLEALEGELTATSPAPLAGYAPSDERPVADVRSRATFTRATGTVEREGEGKGSQEYDEADVTLEGPLSLTLVRALQGEPPRLEFLLSNELRVAALASPPEDDARADAARLAAAGAAGAGGAGLLLAAAYFWPRLKYLLTALAIPMYSRIERTSVLEHEKRDQIYELIRQAPGIHAHEIGERAQIGWGTTVYHLKLLESHSLVVSKKSGRYKRFFVNTGEYTKKKEVYGALRNDTAKAVAQYVVDHPGTSQKDLCAALGIQPSLASWHVEKLEGVGLVKRVKDGRQVRYFAGPAWTDLNVTVHPGGGADAPAET